MLPLAISAGEDVCSLATIGVEIEMLVTAHKLVTTKVSMVLMASETFTGHCGLAFDYSKYARASQSCRAKLVDGLASGHHASASQSRAVISWRASCRPKARTPRPMNTNVYEANSGLPIKPHACGSLSCVDLDATVRECHLLARSLHPAQADKCQGQDPHDASAGPRRYGALPETP